MRRLLVVLLVACTAEHPSVLGTSTGIVPSDAGVVTPKPDAATTSDAGSTPDGAAPRNALLSDVQHPTELQASATRLVWLRDDPVSGAVLTAPTGGGATTTLASSLVAAAGLQIDDTNAYLLVGGPAPAVTKVALGGGPLVTLLGASAPSPLRGLDLDAQYVYFTNGSHLDRVAKAGGPVTTVTTGLAAPTAVAVDGDHAWVVESGDSGAIVEVALAGGTKTTLASDLANPRDVVAATDAIYWIDDGTFDAQSQTLVGAAIRRLPRSGGPATVVVTGSTEHLAVVGTTLYAARGSSIVRFDASPTKLATTTTAVGLSAAGTFLYWTEPGTSDRGFADGAILAVTR